MIHKNKIITNLFKTHVQSMKMISNHCQISDKHPSNSLDQITEQAVNLKTILHSFWVAMKNWKMPATSHILLYEKLPYDNVTCWAPLSLTHLRIFCFFLSNRIVITCFGSVKRKFQGICSREISISFFFTIYYWSFEWILASIICSSHG